MGVIYVNFKGDWIVNELNVYMIFWNVIFK